MIVKAVFLVEILTNFNFYVCFLAAFLLSDVPLYADENKNAASASEFDQPGYIGIINSASIPTKARATEMISFRLGFRLPKKHISVETIITPPVTMGY